ncbi:MAG: IS630 family transposase [Hyphomicrobiales bacterium]
MHAKAQEAVRMRVVQAVRDGMPQTEAARVFGVSLRSVSGWMRLSRKGGAAALKARQRGRPRKPRLAGYQAALTVRTIQERCPDQAKMPFVLWTRAAVQEFLLRRFGIKVSVWTVGRYLKRWGFTPQKPVRRAYEQNPEAVKRWLEVEYPSIRRQAKAEHAEIHWGDEMGLRSDHQAGRSYGRRGRTPVIPGTGQRFGCNMISTVTNRGKLAFMVFEGKFNAKVCITFFRRLLRHSSRKVIVILDGHPVHRSRAFSRWLEEHQTQIRMFLLPGYSPELNPDELLNNDVKSNALGRLRARRPAQLHYQVRSFLWSRQKHPETVRRYFHGAHVRYAMS